MRTDDLNKDFDIIVIGAGIAGLSAGLSAARLGRSTLVLTGDVLGGHLLSIETVEGVPGYANGIAGYDLCPTVQEQASDVGAEFAMESVTRLEPKDGAWSVATHASEYTAAAVIVATGTAFKLLDVPGETLLRGKGVSQCASCDAPLLKDKPVVVVGGGDSALQEALTLAEHVAQVTVLHHGADLTGQRSFKERTKAHPKIEIKPNCVVLDILGDDAVAGVRVRDLVAETDSQIDAAGVFAFIGLEPKVEFTVPNLSVDAAGYILTDTQMRTELAGLFAAGTVRANSAGRAAAAAGEGSTAAVAADEYLASGKWRESD